MNPEQTNRSSSNRAGSGLSPNPSGDAPEVAKKPSVLFPLATLLGVIVLLMLAISNYSGLVS